MTDLNIFSNQSIVELKPIMLVGLRTRTSYQNEINPDKAKISSIISRFWSEGISTKFTNRKNPGTTVAAYYNYESDEYGPYDYFYGEEVTSFENVPSELDTLIIPATKYCKLTTKYGTMPQIVIEAWQQIWKMSDLEFGSKRQYGVDFEVYDNRALDRSNTALDIYIGIH